MKIKEEKYEEIDSELLNLIIIHDHVHDMWFRAEYEDIVDKLKEVSNKSKEIIKIIKKGIKK